MWICGFLGSLEYLPSQRGLCKSKDVLSAPEREFYPKARKCCREEWADQAVLAKATSGALLDCNSFQVGFNHMYCQINVVQLYCMGRFSAAKTRRFLWSILETVDRSFHVSLRCQHGHTEANDTQLSNLD